MLHSSERKAVLSILLLLVSSPTLRGAAEGSTEAPDGWRSFSVREEIAPRFWVEKSFDATGGTVDYGLGLAGRGSEAVDGRWMRTVPVEPGKFYDFRAAFLAKGVESLERSVLARVVFQNAAGEQVGQPEYPSTLPEARAEGPRAAGAVYEAPAGAAKARIELHLRWTAHGEVVWRGAGLRETQKPAKRAVRLAAVNHRPRGPTVRANLEKFAALIEDAAHQGADIVCLPEGITVAGTGKKYADVAEAVPGPSTEVLGAAAAKNKLHVAAGIYERDGSAVYNVSVLLGPDGRLLGKYRKVCLPREEIDGGITPGEEYPVFDTRAGRVGMMICWDVHFPEVARELSHRGAELILLPIWGGNETLARARAIENQVYLVASGYDFKTAIYDRTGKPLAEAKSDPEVITAEIDLSERTLWPWLGDFRARIWREGPASGGAK